MRVDLIKKVTEYCPATQGNIQEDIIESCPLSILQLRDELLVLGNILEENIDQQIYVATIRAGFANASYAVVALQLIDDTLHVAASAQEGLIKQNTCAKAIQKIKSVISGESKPVDAKKTHIFFWLCFLVSIVALVSIRGCVLNSHRNGNSGVATTSPSSTVDPLNSEIQEMLELTKSFNDVARQYNNYAEEYNLAVSLACVANLEHFPPMLDTITLPSEAYEDVVARVRSGKYSKDTVKAEIKTVRDWIEQAKALVAIVKQITVPPEEWVISKLSNVGSITGTEAVTTNNDPDGLLGKEGGFTACIYFTVLGIDPNTIPGDGIVGKGTDAGGAVEIYPSIKDAEARCQYLSGFDGSVLYSGSYAIVGTMVIRTSYKLSNEQQVELTNAITMALTTLSTNSN